MFFSYLRHFDDLDTRRLNVISTMEDLLEPGIGDIYYIMDPYLDVVKSIQQPFREDHIENENWSFLLANLARKNVEFKIITRESLEGIIGIRENPPFPIAVADYINGATIHVCKYTDTKYLGLTIHDRYILKQNGTIFKGLHIGPSLADIYNKDISLTLFSESGIQTAIDCFNQLWKECVKTKGWTKG
jgi:hypothetical protein